MLPAIWNILNELSPWLLLGAVVAGLMQLLIPAGSLQRFLTGRSGILASVLVGIPLPLCSCSVIPVGIGLRRDGASSGAAVGFLISTPQTGVDSVLVSGSMLGWPFAIFKVCAALIMGVIGGGLTQVFGDDSEAAPQMMSDETEGDRSLADRSFGALLHSVELLRSIWRWLVFGIVVSAAISWWVPPAQLTGLVGASGLAALLLTLLVSLPLYVCATASVPIAAALVSSGLPVGAAMVFLMAGPATNLATLGAVFRTFGPKTTCVYLLTMISGSVAAGLLFDSFLPAQMVGNLIQHNHANWFSHICSVAVLGMIGWFAFEDLRRHFWHVPAKGDIRYRITGMTCENCAAGLERDFKKVAGIDNVTVQFSTAEARIEGNPVQGDIMEVFSNKGFTAEKIGPDEIETEKHVTN
jgi:uncharacterized membrane protein YraQ (UPF0718 family)/copper chaperone CopZ